MNLETHEHVVRQIVIELSGRIDAFHATGLRERIDKLFSEGISHFVLDLSHVQFLDSSGLAVLVSLLKRSKQSDGDVKMVMPESEAATRILRLTRFDKVFDIAPTVEEALKSL